MPRLKAAKRSPALPADADGRCLTVLQLTPALNDGGAELSAVEMAGYLHRHGHRALVASSGGKRLNDLIKNGGMFFSLPLASKNPLRWIWNGWRLRCLIIEQRVQLVHARSRAPAWSGWLAARWAGVPFVATFHGTYSLGWFGLKRFYNSVMLRGPLVIANSQFIKGHLVENYGVAPQRVVVAARGIDPAQYDVGLFNQKQRVTMRAAWGCGEDEVVLVMVGRLTSWKGHRLLLAALALVPPDLKWKLIVVGGEEKGDDYGAELRQLAEQLGIGERIVWLGSRPDVAAIYHAGDVGLSCSTRPEAFGRVAVEAMAMGKPVIATALGGSLETILDGVTGWLVTGLPDDRVTGLPGYRVTGLPDDRVTGLPGYRVTGLPDDRVTGLPGARGEALGDGEIGPQALAQSIERALRNQRDLPKMGKAARAHVLANFTVERCCAAEMQAYTRVLAMRRARGDGTAA